MIVRRPLRDAAMARTCSAWTIPDCGKRPVPDAAPVTDAADARTAPPAPDAAPAVTSQSALRRFVDTRLGVLRERDIRLLFTGDTASSAGSSMVPVALSFAVLKNGHGSGAVGAVPSAETIPLVVLLLLGGAIADRMPLPKVMDTVLQRNVPPMMLSRVSPYHWLGMIALSPVGCALAGSAARLAGPCAVPLFGAAFAEVSTRALFAVGAIRRLSWHDA